MHLRVQVVILRVQDTGAFWEGLPPFPPMRMRHSAPLAYRSASLIVLPVLADSRAASRMRTTITFVSSAESPVGLISPETTAIRYEIESLYGAVRAGADFCSSSSSTFRRTGRST